VHPALLDRLSRRRYSWVMPPDSETLTPAQLGEHLKRSRKAVGLTLRQVEEKTNRAVKNGYLSQIESGDIQRPSPGILWELAAVYGLDYRELLVQAGHRVPEAQVPEAMRAIAGMPLHAFKDLNEEERRLLVEYAAFLKSRRKAPR